VARSTQYQKGKSRQIGTSHLAIYDAITHGNLSSTFCCYIYYQPMFAACYNSADSSQGLAIHNTISKVQFIQKQLIYWSIWSLKAQLMLLDSS